MMYSDYFALSSCAISVTFIPFMVICQLRYALILQAFNYENRRFLRWLRCAYLAAGAPLLAITGLALLCEAVFVAYLTHTAATEMQIIIGYAVLMLLSCGAIAVGFGRFCRVLGGAGWTVPRIDDVRLLILFLLGSGLTAVIMLFLNLYALQQVIYFVPLATPFFVPLFNLFFPARPGHVKAGPKVWDEDLPRFEEEEISAPEETKRWRHKSIQGM